MTAQNRVLLVEDSTDCQKLVTRALGEEASVLVAPDLKSAERILKEGPVDLLLLDVSLPDGTGFHFCSRLTSELGLNRPRVLFLTGSAEIGDKLTGFSVGGDDYLVKPFEPLELKARVQAHLRHQKQLHEASQSVKVGNLEMNFLNYSASIHLPDRVTRLDLTLSEFKVLYQLAKNCGRVLTRERLLAAISDENIEVSDRTIDVHVSRIRKKILGCTHGIEPIYGVGYRMNQEDR